MKTTSMKNDFSKVQKDETSVAYFSEKAAGLYGVYFADITDDQGKTKKIAYTCITSKEKSEDYLWADKIQVWSGKMSDISRVRKYKDGFEYPSQDILNKTANDRVSLKNKLKR